MRNKRTRIKNRIKLLGILLFTIILPTIIGTQLFANFNGIINNIDHKNGEQAPKDKLALSSPSSSLPNADYFNYYKVITIDHTKVSGSVDHQNFPVLISIIDSDLKVKAQTSGDDIAFANNTNWLDYEIELYDPLYSGTEARLIAWVRLPLLSTSMDTNIFMFYGNSTIGSQENPIGVWDANYDGVWHLKEDPGFGGTAQDSTSNNNDGTAFNMEAQDQIQGQIDGSFRFNGINEYVSVGNVGPEIKTIELWMNPDTLTASNGQTTTGYQNPTATGETYNDWTNPTYAYFSDNFRASIFGFPDSQDYYNFSFNIPINALISGIQVSIEGRSGSPGTSSVRISLSWDGGNSYTNYYQLNWYSTTDQYQSAGGSTNNWGKSGGWSPSELNNANFRVLLDESGSVALQVDHLRVRVYYSLPSDLPVIELNSNAQLSIDKDNAEIKAINFPGTTSIYVNGTTENKVSIGSWYHVVITDTTGVDASAFYIARNSSQYYDGIIDEVRLSKLIYSSDWIITEYNNQYDPDSFYFISEERSPLTDIQVNALDLYGNIIPNVNISMIKDNKIIKSKIADTSGSVLFDNIISIEDKYNFSVSMTSNIYPYNSIIINRTSEAILIEGAFQIINLICNISRNIFSVVDLDGMPLDSGWVIVGNYTDPIQNCTIDNTGHATFRWLNNTAYNYTVWYRDVNYKPHEIIVSTGDILKSQYNSEINVTTILTTVNFTLLTQDSPQPVDGAKLILGNLNSGENIVNLTTDLAGKATLRWVNSSSINSNYSLEVSFYGKLWDFEIVALMTGVTSKANFSVKAKAAYNISIILAPTELEKFESLLVNLNPITNIQVEWGAKITLRALFNITKVPSGYENFTGPTYAEPMSCKIFEGSILIFSKIMPIEEDYIGRHKMELETANLESGKVYLIRILAQKPGYVLPPDIIMSLYLLENELIVNQSENDDTPESVYWQDIAYMSLKPYGIISEDFNIEYSIDANNTFKFSIPSISNEWVLSRIVFNVYNVTFGVDNEEKINLNITDDFGVKHNFDSSWDHYYHSQYANNGSWSYLEVSLNKGEVTSGDTFNFTFDGTFVGDIDIIATSYYIRDKINVQYSKFNITDTLSILTMPEGWAIQNITFLIYDCYNYSAGTKANLSTLTNLNIITNEGYKYSLNEGDSNGNGILTIEDRIIYPLDDQFLFNIDANGNITFNVMIKIEYIQEFFQYQYLENINISKTESNFIKTDTFQVKFIEKEWVEDYATLRFSGIASGLEKYLPSEIDMTISINGQTFNIEDFAEGEGIFSLMGFEKDSILTAIIEINPFYSVTFNLSFMMHYLRTEIYETKGIISYSVLENPAIYGTVQFYEDLDCYLQPINTSLLNAYEYTIRFTMNKENYISASKDLNLIVLNRLTMLNGTSGFFRKIENIYVNDAVNFTFSYTDVMKGTNIADLTAAYYIWEKYDIEGNIIASGQGNLIPTIDNLYVLDLDTENLTIGDYFLILTIGKKNYEYKNAMISLTVNKRIIDFVLNDGITQINVKQGEIAVLRLELTDRTRGGIPLENATVLLSIMGNEYEFEIAGPGIYIFNFHTSNIDTFFNPKTFTGKINITKEDYISEEFSITIVVGMEEIFPGMPIFYFILIVSTTLGLIGSIVAYRTYKRSKIPTFVKKVREMKKIIDSGKTIQEELLYRDKEAFIGEIVKNKWEKLGLSLEEIFGITIKKDKKEYKTRRMISGATRTHDNKPLGLLFMKWDEKIGTEILVKYPEDIKISSKSLMQVYSTHEYSGEKGVITLITESLN
ncbi:MAG: hypothetical protein ACFE9N_16305, partial [Promethearchaeota archaeon]